MTALFVTGAGTEIGKTYAACRIIEALRARGRGVEALKPIVSGIDEGDQGSDPALLLRALGRAATAEAVAHVSPWRFKAPLAANMAARMEGRALVFEEIVEVCRARSGDPLVIEGAGGVMAPLDDHHTALDLIAALKAPALLVTGSYLGAISHTLTACAAMRARGHAPRCVIVNESVGGVDLDQTVAALQRLAPELAFMPLRRGAAVGADMIDLVAPA